LLGRLTIPYFPLSNSMLERASSGSNLVVSINAFATTMAPLFVYTDDVVDHIIQGATIRTPAAA